MFVEIRPGDEAVEVRGRADVSVDVGVVDADEEVRNSKVDIRRMKVDIRRTKVDLCRTICRGKFGHLGLFAVRTNEAGGIYWKKS